MSQIVKKITMLGIILALVAIFYLHSGFPQALAARRRRIKRLRLKPIVQFEPDDDPTGIDLTNVLTGATSPTNLVPLPPMGSDRPSLWLDPTTNPLPDFLIPSTHPTNDPGLDTLIPSLDPTTDPGLLSLSPDPTNDPGLDIPIPKAPVSDLMIPPLDPTSDPRPNLMIPLDPTSDPRPALLIPMDSTNVPRPDRLSPSLDPTAVPVLDVKIPSDPTNEPGQDFMTLDPTPIPAADLVIPLDPTNTPGSDLSVAPMDPNQDPALDFLSSSLEPTHPPGSVRRDRPDIESLADFEQILPLDMIFSTLENDYLYLESNLSDMGNPFFMSSKLDDDLLSPDFFPDEDLDDYSEFLATQIGEDFDSADLSGLPDYGDILAPPPTNFPSSTTNSHPDETHLSATTFKPMLPPSISLRKNSSQKENESLPELLSPHRDMENVTSSPEIIALMSPLGPIEGQSARNIPSRGREARGNDTLLPENEFSPPPTTQLACCPCSEELQMSSPALLKLMQARGPKSLVTLADLEALLSVEPDFLSTILPDTTTKSATLEGEKEIESTESIKDDIPPTDSMLEEIARTKLVLEEIASTKSTQEEIITSTEAIVDEAETTVESMAEEPQITTLGIEPSEDDAEDLQIISQAILRVMRARGVKSLKGFSEIDSLLMSVEEIEAENTTIEPTIEGDTTTDPSEDEEEEGTTTEPLVDLETETVASNSTEEGESAGLLANPVSDIIKKTFGKYFERLKTIFELDLKLLEQLSNILKKVDSDALPALSTALEPGLMAVTGGNLDLAKLIGHLTNTLKKSEFEGAVKTKLKNLDFIEVGPLQLPQELLVDDHFIHFISKLILTEFDKTGLGFPIRGLIVGPSVLATLKDQSRKHHLDYIVTEIISSKIKEFIRASDLFVSVSDGEILLESFTGRVSLVEGCKVTAVVPSAVVKAKVYGSSDLRVAANVAKPDDKLKTSIILGGDLDVTLNVKGSAAVRLGKRVFSKCFTKFRNEFPMSLLSQGKVWVGARILARGVRIEDRPGKAQVFHQATNSYHPMPGYSTMQKFLVFKFDLRLDAKILRWNVDHIGITGCEVRFLGLKVISFCGLIKRTLSDYITRFAYEFSEVHLPQVLRKVELLLRKRVGDEIAIPLFLAEEKAETISTLLQKVENVAKLKEDLITDLSNVAKLKGDLIKDLSNVAKTIGDTLGG